ncbi:hypothetical protein AAVH_04121 [Aphelenchoides avenae]|nr:hypothetical protein AAVH_04121 [Aphelenchus avenae]
MKFVLFLLLALPASYATTCVFNPTRNEEGCCGSVSLVDLQDEAKCREAAPTHQGAFYVMAAVVVLTNLVFLAASVYLFVSKAVDDAEEKAHQLMDAVLVVLLPDEALRMIEDGADENHAKKN